MKIKHDDNEKKRKAIIIEPDGAQTEYDSFVLIGMEPDKNQCRTVGEYKSSDTPYIVCRLGEMLYSIAEYSPLSTVEGLAGVLAKHRAEASVKGGKDADQS